MTVSPGSFGGSPYGPLFLKTLSRAQTHAQTGYPGTDGEKEWAGFTSSTESPFRTKMLSVHPCVVQRLIVHCPAPAVLRRRSPMFRSRGIVILKGDIAIVATVLRPYGVIRLGLNKRTYQRHRCHSTTFILKAHESLFK